MASDTKRSASKQGRPTLQTIADRLNVSRATVSNAYSRPDQLNPELRKRILEVAREIGYAGPNPAARNLRRGRTDTVGVLFTEELTFAFSDPAAVAFLRGISEVLTHRELSLLLLPSPPGAEQRSSAILDAAVDGFIVYCMPDDDDRYPQLLDRKLPTVMVDEHRTQNSAFVGIDDYGGAKSVAEHLLAFGHRSFAIVTDRLRPDNYAGIADIERQRSATFGVNIERLRGYADAIEASGVPWESVPVMEGFPISPQTGARCASVLLDRPDPPSAIICTSDQMALGVLDAARSRGINVPAALSVAGFDDIDEAARSSPGLTTVRQPLLEKGRTAGRLLLEDWQPDSPPEVILPTELVIRASTGPTPN